MPPCYECPNGKWKYGKNGDCQFETKNKCRDAELAILIDKMNVIKDKINKNNKDYGKS
jgi:hypothetical protein